MSITNTPTTTYETEIWREAFRGARWRCYEIAPVLGTIHAKRYVYREVLVDFWADIDDPEIMGYVQLRDDTFEVERNVTLWQWEVRASSGAVLLEGVLWDEPQNFKGPSIPGTGTRITFLPIPVGL